LRRGVLWTVAPGYMMWAQMGNHVDVPWRAFVLNSLTRLMCFAAMAWFLIAGNWFGAIFVAIALLLMGLANAGIHKLLSRIPSRNERT
jgi:hypothetical protein